MWPVWVYFQKQFYETVSCSVMVNSFQPRVLQSSRLFCLWNSPGKNTGGSSYFPSPGALPNPGIKPKSPALQADYLPPCDYLGFPGGSDSKVCLKCRRPEINLWVRKISWRRERFPTPVFLPGEFPEQRSLAGGLQSMGTERVRHN